MERIDVTLTPSADGWMAGVTISNGGSTDHRVTLREQDYQRLTQGVVSPEQCVRLSFEFLLEREPKGSILRQFDLSVIGRYFPDFEEDLARRLSSRG